jgi:hypothetical protein
MSFNFICTRIKLYENFQLCSAVLRIFMAVLGLKSNRTFTDNCKALLLLDFTI